MQRMVRRGHQNKPLAGHRNAWFVATTRTNLLAALFEWRRLTPMCRVSLEIFPYVRGFIGVDLGGSMQSMVRCDQQNKPLAGRCNAWFAAAIGTHLLDVLLEYEPH